MKKLFLFAITLILAVSASAQIVKIRYHYVDKPNVHRTFVYHPQGEPTGIYRLAVDHNGGYYFWGEMLKKLKQPIWPDVPFTDLMPDLPEIPARYIRVDNGMGGRMWIKNPDYQPAVDLYDQLLSIYNHQCQIPHGNARITLLQQYTFKTLDDSPGVVWELIDETKPYHDGRFTQIPVVPGKYSKTHDWKEYFAPGDDLYENLWWMYSNSSAILGGVRGLKFLSSGK